MNQDGNEPAPVRAPARLTVRERRRVAVLAAGPIVAAVVVLTPVALATGAGAGDVLGASMVYGGLLGLAAAFVAVERLQGRQCPACRRRPPRDDATCECGYDLARRPRYACAERHAIYLEGGTCRCGRPALPLPSAIGVGSQVAVVARIGGWLLLFLVLVGAVLYVLESRL